MAAVAVPHVEAEAVAALRLGGSVYHKACRSPTSQCNNDLQQSNCSGNAVTSIAQAALSLRSVDVTC
eukprot:3269715-Amphidinium_carterae.1